MKYSFKEAGAKHIAAKMNANKITRRITSFTALTHPKLFALAQTPQIAFLPREIPANVRAACSPTAASDVSHAASRDTKHTPPQTAARPAGPSAGSTKFDSAPDQSTQTAAATRACSSRYVAAATRRQNSVCSIRQIICADQNAGPAVQRTPAAPARV